MAMAHDLWRVLLGIGRRPSLLFAFSFTFLGTHAEPEGASYPKACGTEAACAVRGVAARPGSSALGTAVTNSSTAEARVCDSAEGCGAALSMGHTDAGGWAAMPTIYFVFGTPTPDNLLPVTIYWSSNYPLDLNSLRITFNGQSVEDQFSHIQQGPGSLRSEGMVGLKGGRNYLEAYICDSFAECAMWYDYYDYQPDLSPPTITVAPAGGEVAWRDTTVVIQWCDDYGLVETSRKITLNGVDITGAFNYAWGTKSGCTAYATSSGVIVLREGANTLVASIQDPSGKTGQASITYTVPIAGVAVTPDGGSVTAAPNTGRTQTFTVKNTGTKGATYTFEATCSGTATGCSVSSNTATLAAGASTTVTVNYTVGGAGTVGSVQLLARRDADNVLDVGYVNVTVSAGSALVVDVGTANPGPAIARDLCLTIAAGPSAASECGDLRIVHPLPTTTTYNKARTPTLLYNSQHAHPYPTVSAYVTLPASGGPTDSVVAVLRLGVAQRARRAWAGTGWAAGQTRLITLGFDGLDLTTGVYAYTLEVAWYPGGGQPVTGTGTGELIVINRKDSAFGAGWWLAGLEQLLPVDASRMLWIGGDGSARIYTKVGTNAWAAPVLTRPDTLRSDGVYYARLLPGGDTVRFDAAGQHVATTNRLGHRTTFTYSGGRLATISLPVPAGAPARTYDFTYDANNKLDKVTAPPVSQGGVLQSRVTEVTVTSGRLTAIADPGLPSVSFGYDASFAHRITRRTNRLGHVTAYAFDATAKLSQVRRYMSGTSPGSSDLITGILNLERRSYDAPQPRDQAYTQVDGPRTDVSDLTRFYLGRWGAPVKIQDALGHVTELERMDARLPALVTRVAYPVQPDGSRRVVVATYDPRGNVKSITEINPYGDGRNATTRYGYDNPAWPDFVTRIVPPMKDSVVIAYRPDGNRDWQQDARGSASRVYFDYHPSGLLRSVDGPLTPPESFSYDLYGNLSRAVTPVGFVSEYLKDEIGRDTLILTPTDSAQTPAYRQRQRLEYDAAGRVRKVETIGPALGSAPQLTRVVLNHYNAEGALDSLSTWSSPNVIDTFKTRWVYDRAGRVIKEIAHDGMADSTVYDPAGNPVRVITRRGDTLTMEYDALNRLKKRRIPAVRYDSVTQGMAARESARYLWIPGTTHWYPLYPNDPSGGYSIAADSALFDYDALGNITVANNGDAQVSRRYYPGGALKSDTLRIRTVNGSDFNTHVYGIEYAYDLNGRRTDLIHPSNLRSGTPRDRTSYVYDAQTGLLKTVVDLLGNAFRYEYDAEGRLVSLTLPGGIREGYAYDGDGRLTRHEVLNGSTSPYKWSEPKLRDATLRYDGRDKLTHTLNAAGTRDTLLASYDGLGHLIGSSFSSHGHEYLTGVPVTSRVAEAFRYDALGNLLYSESGTTREYPADPPSFFLRNKYYIYDASSGRLALTQEGSPARVDTLFYDAAGNTRFLTQKQVDHTYEDRASYYGADGRLRAADYRWLFRTDTELSYRGAFEESRYDALGRRVLVRSRGSCVNDPNAISGVCRQSPVRRIVWDGDEVLYEIQMPGEDGSAYLENDTGPVILPVVQDTVPLAPKVDQNLFYGRVAYTHGHRLDQPLSVIRLGYGARLDTARVDRGHKSFAPFAIVPLWSRNGEADVGVFADGGTRWCDRSGGITRCVVINWPSEYYAYAWFAVRRLSWHGSLLEDGREKSGTLYRRNRYYDPLTGRFTQEDPIGLAGGLNLYGYANGDPVTYSDPFGLCPEYAGGDGRTDTPDDCPREVLDAWAATHIHVKDGVNWDRVSPFLKDAVIKASIALNVHLRISGGAEAAGHSERSFHRHGLAVDISAVNGTFFTDLRPGERNAMADILTTEILKRIPVRRRAEVFTPLFSVRYDKKLDSGTLASLTKSHYHHVHVSIRW